MSTLTSVFESVVTSSVVDTIIPSVIKYYQTTYNTELTKTELYDVLGIKDVKPVATPQARRSPRKDENKVTCSATTTKGERCTHPAKHGDFCGVHAKDKKSAKETSQPQHNFPQPTVKSGLTIKPQSGARGVAIAKPLTQPVKITKPAGETASSASKPINPMPKPVIKKPLKPVAKATIPPKEEEDNYDDED